MMLCEMAEELRRSAAISPGAFGFRKQGTPPRAVATLLAKSIREMGEPFRGMMGVYRPGEAEEFAAALERGELDDVLAEILKPPAADAAG
jgi:hypothetical protein